MGHRNGAYVVETLQDHLEVEDHCTLFCRCHHSRQMPIERLIEIFGSDFNVRPHRDYFLGRFRCERCGARPMTVHFTPGNVPKRW